MATDTFALPGFSYLLDLMQISHAGQPARTVTLIEAFIASAERAGVDAQQVRLMRGRLAQLQGETGPDPVAGTPLPRGRLTP